MGRGLSPLQRWILTTAADRHVHPLPGKDGTGTRLYYSEILVGFYGWEPTRDPIYYGERHGEYAGQVNPGGQHFSVDVIGRNKYASAMSALSRATGRLEKRGLVDCLRGMSRWSAVVITDAGLKLTVNIGARGPQSEPIDVTAEIVAGLPQSEPIEANGYQSPIVVLAQPIATADPAPGGAS